MAKRFKKKNDSLFIKVLLVVSLGFVSFILGAKLHREISDAEQMAKKTIGDTIKDVGEKVKE